ncbi:hypothetical protein ABZ897_54845 [Nonomuraea sp. NPDC046802]|uniref:hypothetical protein n=1 Tax=Nonomuraea sp. NPDC046802 TaxID=3154919 RepID=UPI0033C7F6BB
MTKTSAVVALSTAALLALAATPATAAALGTITLRSSSGAVFSISNPRSGCYSTRATFTNIANNTDSAVTVYVNQACTEPFSGSMASAPGNSMIAMPVFGR